MKALARWAVALAAALVVAASGCSSGNGHDAASSTTTAPRRSLPPTVEMRDEPEGVTLGDPAFTALRGAHADFGRLGGTVYQIEMPDRWNGKLVLFMHGYAVRLRTNSDLRRRFLAGSKTTGELEMPLLTLHTTGDGQVPIGQARIYRRRVDAAGASDLMVQRVVRDPGHCGFTDAEWAANLEALDSWVEHGRRPSGTDVLVRDLRDLDHTFDVAPRPGTREASAIEGADDRAVLRGTLTLDGRPVDSRYLGAVVVHDGLSTPCQLTLPPVVGGRFEITVLADAESAGCGRPGASVYLWALANDQEVYSTDAITWPGDGRSVTGAASLSARDPAGGAPVTVDVWGEVLGPDGHYLPPGTRVEAFVGDTRCGVASTRRTGSFSGYTMSIAGPDAVAGCTAGTVTFRVDGRPVHQTMRNQPGKGAQLDLNTG